MINTQTFAEQWPHYRVAGFAEHEAHELWNGHLRIIPTAELASDPQLAPLRYSGDFNRYANETDWTHLPLQYPRTTPAFFLCDAYYRRLYPALPAVQHAVYGEHGIEWAVEDLPVEVLPPARVHHRRVPRFIARSQDDIARVATTIQAQAAEDPSPILYRGQTQAHTLRRTPGALQFLYGTLDAHEPSLLSSAVRHEVDGETVLAQFYAEMQSAAYDAHELHDAAQWFSNTVRNAPDVSVIEESHPLFHRHSHTVFRSGSGGHLRELQALAQHYGIPTYGIDLTDRLDVAVWFATNKVETLGEHLTAQLHHWAATTATDWPVVYLFHPPPVYVSHFTVLNEIKRPATRPAAQGARLAFGGWGLQANIVAEDVVAIAHLAPGMRPTSTLPFRSLFPSRHDDPFLDLLLTRKATVSGPTATLYKWVTDV
jgi:hypothetical protein